ncbi:putative G-protein coupled receptor 75 [Brachyhypopomus gauderio]|uniref:putative G-protein coupled receptor 75 n=1 Tax=Brachyhypopomus gauderio TaxID=698409 RepID=UPI004041090F
MCTKNSTAWPLDLSDLARHQAFNSSLGQSPSPGGWALIHTATLASCSLLLILIFCLGSYGNLVVFLSFFDPAFRKLRTNFDFMILNLSFCDLFVCCVTAPMFALVLFLDGGGGGASPGFCFAFHLTSSGFIIMSLETVAVIALHRLRMVLGQQPNHTASFPCTLALTALLWTSSFTLAALVTLRAYPSGTGPCLPHFGLAGRPAQVVLCVYLADFAFCVAVVSVSYVMIAQALHKNAQVRKCPVIAVDATRPQAPFSAAGFEGMQRAVQVPSLYRNQAYGKLQHVQTHPLAKRSAQALAPGAATGATCCQLVSTVNLSTAKDSKAVVTCVVIVISVLLCCLPMGVCLAHDVLAPESGFVHYQFELCGFALIFLKSGINPFVYSRNSAGLRRRLLCCLQWVALGFLCCKHKTRLHAMGKGSLEVNRNKSSHHETNSAYVLSPKPPRRLVDQACGPSCSRDSGPSPRATAGRKPRPPSTSTPINTRIEPYYSIYNSSPSAGPSSPSGLQPVNSHTTAFAKSYVAMHYHSHQEVLQDFDSASAHPIPIPSV